MKSIKKFITGFTVVALMVLGVGMLAACSNSTTNNSGENSVNESGEQKTLIVAMELAYPPFETKDTAGNAEGLSVDFITKFAEAYNYNLTIQNTAWDGLIPSLQTGMADCVISSMTITEEREKQIDFSDGYAVAQLALLTNTNSGIATIDELNQSGKSIAVKTGSTGDIYATNNLPNTEVIRLADESACVTEVIQGKADAFIYDQLTIYRNQLSNPDTTTAVFIPFQNPEQWGVAVKEGNAELLAELNEFIATSKADGTFEELTSKHLAAEKTTFDELGFKWFFDFN